MKLSIVVPGIRVNEWVKLYESIRPSFSGDFELIFVGPHRPPDEIAHKVTFIQDWGSSTRAQQIGISHAKGDWITTMVDDGVYMPDGLNKSFNILTDDKKVVILKYMEGNQFFRMHQANFYEFAFHFDACGRYVPGIFKLMNFCIMHRDVMREIGGYDCAFESIALANLDFAVRCQFKGIIPKLTTTLVLKCDWEPGETGSHAPMHHAYEADYKLYKSIYDNADCELRQSIDMNNWQNAPKIWERRFK